MVAVFQVNWGIFSALTIALNFLSTQLQENICTVLMIKGNVSCFKDRISLLYLFACIAAPAGNLWRVAVLD